MNAVGLIVGMMVVTYLPRLLPALFMERTRFPDWFRRWLESIPYAALAALIFPGVLEVVPDHPEVGLAGAGVALLISFFRVHVLWAMTGSILIVLLMGWMM